uniref:Uncharacterized protein n=1 Tax=Theropithecus gelada TaxID=9565 RepID=A0A8D2E6H0_THEGE
MQYCIRRIDIGVTVGAEEPQWRLCILHSGWRVKRWCEEWLVAAAQCYIEQTRQSVEDKVHMQVECLSIPTGQECQDSQPLDGKSKDCILPGAVAHVYGKAISLCVENTGDCLAWKFTLQDSRTNTAYVGSTVMIHETPVVSSPMQEPPYLARRLYLDDRSLKRWGGE